MYLYIKCQQHHYVLQQQQQQRGEKGKQKTLIWWVVAIHQSFTFFTPSIGNGIIAIVIVIVLCDGVGVRLGSFTPKTISFVLVISISTWTLAFAFAFRFFPPSVQFCMSFYFFFSFASLFSMPNYEYMDFGLRKLDAWRPCRIQKFLRIVDKK